MKKKKTNRLEEAMRTHGVSVNTLAERLGKNCNYITNVRKCYTSLSLPTIYRMAEAIGCNPCELILGYDELKSSDLSVNRSEEIMVGIWKQAATPEDAPPVEEF